MTFFRNLTTVALIATPLAFAAPAAADNTVEVQAELVFDYADLRSEGGVENVLQSLERQANELCTFSHPITRAEIVDRSCAADVLQQAVTKIDSDPLLQAYAANGSNGQRIDRAFTVASN